MAGMETLKIKISKINILLEFSRKVFMSKRHVFVTVVLEKTSKVEERKKEGKRDQLDTDF